MGWLLPKSKSSMENNFRISSICFFLPALFFFILVVPVSAQLNSTDSQVLFQLQKLLEYPETLQWWTNWTNFCYIHPSSSLKIVCTNNRVTELTIIGNKSSPSLSNKPNQALSGAFSIDSLFSTLSNLSGLKAISLVSLGLWGSLPPKINRFSSLQSLNLSSNFISGKIPKEISSLTNLKSLVLGDNLFSGSIPDLSKINNLDELNLSGNRLGPEFPSVSNNLVILNLKNNSFRSEIPSRLKGFTQLLQLDISSNKFSGPIPSFLFSLPSIQYLNLAQNQLTGALTKNTSCGANLMFIDLSNNLLIGTLPPCISKNRKVNSSWNCLSGRNSSSNSQHPASFCNKEALAVEPTKIQQEGKKSSINLVIILGIFGGILAVAGVLALLICIIIKRASKRRYVEDDAANHHDKYIADKMSTRSPTPPPSIPRHVPRTMRSAAIGLHPYRVFTMEEIEDATNNFDTANFMGEGSQGQLYRGWLRDGSVVVVRCLKIKQKQLQQSLMQDLEVLSKLRHRHLASVLGHCVVNYQDHPNSVSTVFVVLEHVSNGSLQDYLTDWRKKEMLKWPQRISITIGAARAIQFLHTGVAPGILGNFLKIDNILLDETLTAKVCSYRIPLTPKAGSESPLLRHEKASQFCSDENADKEDIYQLGVIILEVITGKLVASTDEVDELKLKLEKGLAEGPSKVKVFIDPSIRGTFAYESMRTAVQFAINCLCKDPSKRPSIEDVLWNLQYSIQVQEGWTSSGNLSTQF